MNKLKDSGIPWFGEIPEHWKVEKAKNLFSLRTSKGNDVLEHLAATQTHGMYPQRLLEGVVQVAINTDYTQFRTVHKNDYVISLRSFQGGFEISEYEGVCSPAYQVFYNQIPICHNYFKVLFKSVSFIEFMNSLTVGIREGKNIQFTDFARSYLPVPPLEEQERISTYLDEKCGEIDELIDVEQQMISDLESYRQAVITEAVTHGINPIATTKPTAIPWVPSIPEQWKEIRLKFLSRISTGDKDTIMANDEGEYPFFVRSPKIERINTYSYDGEAILMAGDGVGAGRVFHHFIGKFDWHQRVYNMHELTYNIYGRFLFYFLLTNFHKLIDAGSAKSTVDSVRLPMLTNFITLVPPLSEQKEISNYLDTKCAEIDELIKVKQEKIETLKQYRQSLIFEAVTGKITIV